MAHPLEKKILYHPKKDNTPELWAFVALDVKKSKFRSVIFKIRSIIEYYKIE